MKTVGIVLRCSFLILLLSVSSLAQGITWESTSTITGLTKEVPEKSSYMPGMVRQFNVNENVIIVFRLDKKIIYTIVPEEKSYSELSFDDMEKMMKKMSGQMDEKMKQMKEQMASMPEDQRKQMEEMMGGKMMEAMKSGKIEVKNTGKKQSLAGYNCTEFLITKDGNEFATIWATKEIPGFAAMTDDMKEFTARMASMIPRNGAAFGQGLMKVEGFPMIMDIKGVMTTRVTKVEKKNTPLPDFEIPAGFKKEEMHYGG
jgi:hypothetical protein